MSLLTKPPAFLDGELPEGVTRYPTDQAEIYLWERFLLPSECRQLINETNGGYQPSTTAIRERQSERSSFTCTLQTPPGSVGAKLEAKLAEVTGHPLTHSDLMQAQLYEKGGQYPYHYDFFIPNMPGCNQELADGGQRSWTFMMYLNTPKEGGGTDFSELGATFAAKAGRALFWNNLHADGSPNRATLHAGMKVVRGKKYIVTKWFRENERSVQAMHVQHSLGLRRAG